MSLQRVPKNPWIGPYQNQALGRRNLVDASPSCYQTQNPASRRPDSNRLMPEAPISFSSYHGTYPLTATALPTSPTSPRAPSSQLPLSNRDLRTPMPQYQTQTRARVEPTAQHPESMGYIAQTRDNIAESQAESAYARPARKSSNRDEFDGPHQLLNFPSPRTIAAKDQPFPVVPVSLGSEEQGDVLDRVKDVLSKCAFDFVARYQFPIPIDPEKRLVIRPQDREWMEWVYLLKRLATKRRIPSRVLYDNQIKHFVTVLENSLEPPTLQDRPLKDDRTILQFISAGIQVAKMLKDSAAMSHLDRLYTQTASCMQDRRLTGLPI